MSNGRIIFWSAEGVSVNAKQVVDAGLGDYLSKTQPRSYLRKAIDEVNRKNRTADAKRTKEYFNQGDGSYQYVVIDVRRIDGEIKTAEFSIYINRLGQVSCDEKYRETQTYKEIKQVYNERTSGQQIKGAEVSEIFKGYVKRELVAFPLKKGGGVWLVDERFKDETDSLIESAKKLGVNITTLNFASDGNELSVSEIVKNGLEDEVESLIKGLISTTEKVDREELTEHQVLARKQKVESQRDRLVKHKDNLKEFYETLNSRLKEVDKALEIADLGGAKKDSFIDLLQGLGD